MQANVRNEISYQSSLYYFTGITDHPNVLAGDLPKVSVSDGETHRAVINSEIASKNPGNVAEEVPDHVSISQQNAVLKDQAVAFSDSGASVQDKGIGFIHIQPEFFRKVKKVEESKTFLARCC